MPDPTVHTPRPPLVSPTNLRPSLRNARHKCQPTSRDRLRVLLSNVLPDWPDCLAPGTSAACSRIGRQWPPASSPPALQTGREYRGLWHNRPAYYSTPPTIDAVQPWSGWARWICADPDRPQSLPTAFESDQS